MNIHVLLKLGVDVFESYEKQKKDNDSPYINDYLEYIDPIVLNKYRTAFIFYTSFENSGHSYLVAFIRTYCLGTTDPNADIILNEALESINDTDKKNHYRCFEATLENAFYQLIFKRPSHFKSFHRTNHLSLADRDIRLKKFPHDEALVPYSFFDDIITSKEMKFFAYLLLFSGMLCLAIGTGGFLSIAAANTALKAMGISATAATLSGGVSASLGAAFLLFKPKIPLHQLSTMASFSSSRQALGLFVDAVPDSAKSAITYRESNSSNSVLNNTLITDWEDQHHSSHAENS